MLHPIFSYLPPVVQIILLQPVALVGYVEPIWILIAAALAIIILISLAARALRPRYYFFVRHGQTVSNAARIRQGEGGGLSESGIHQAERIAAFLTPFHIRRIYASPYERTRQTAKIIARTLHCRVRYSKLLVERRNPSEIIGKSTDDPAIKKIGDMIDLTFHNDNYRYSDEENFIDLKKRARRALRFLAHRRHRRMCVVTHGIFLKMIVAYLLYQKDLHANEWMTLSFFNSADNAGVTLCRYRPLHRFSETRGWDVLSYNITLPTEFAPATGRGISNLNDLRDS